MSKYKIIMLYPEGEDEQDDIFDSEEDAEYYANYLCSCAKEGSEILNLSNPGDDPLVDEEIGYEIIEIEE